MSLAEIAETLGYPTPAAAAKAMHDQLRREARTLPREERTEMLDLELNRLNYMLTKIWAQVEFGDLRAIETAMKIIAMRAKLTGLDVPEADTARATVLVVGGAEADYIKALQAAD